MKKLLNIFLIFILIILLAAITAPIIFKGKIIEIAKVQINNSLDAHSEFEDLTLSFIKKFPYLSIELKGLVITGKDRFEGDTLVAFESFGIAADVISILNGTEVKIKSIILEKPVINGIILEDGTANWDIVPEDDSIEEPIDTTESEMPDINITLKKFQINQANIHYLDKSSNMEAKIRDFTFLLTGDFSKDFSTLAIASDVVSFDYWMDGMRYVKEAPLNLTMAIDANLKDNVFTLKDNTFTINDLTLGWDGTFTMPEEAPMDIDLTYFTKETSFKSLLSMVPAVYMQDFQSVQTSGKLALEGYVKGKYNESIMPDVGLNLSVNDARFQYPDLPKAIDNIGIDVKVFFDGLDNDNSTVDVNRFHLEIADNPLDMVLNIKTPVSDMQINGNLIGNLDLAAFTDVIPMENTTLRGQIDMQIDMLGSLSMIEEERYQDFKADGKILVNDLIYSSPDVPKEFVLDHTEVLFSPRFVEIVSLNAGLGKSDFQFTGKLENFVPYALSDGVLEGSFVFSSTLLDLNEFLAADDAEEVEEDTTEVPLAVFEVPSDLDLTLYSDLKTIYYGNLTLENAKGTVSVRNSRVILDEFLLSTLGGSMALNGEYNTQDIEAPMMDMKLKINKVNIPATYTAFNTVEKLAPVAQNLSGNISSTLEFTAFLDSSMSPILNSMVGLGTLSSDNIIVEKSNTLNKLANTLNSKSFNDLSLRNVDLSFEIRNGRIYIDPFDLKMGKTTMVVSGDQGIDQSLNYNLNIVMPKSGVADAAFSGLASAANLGGMNLSPLDNINLDVAVGGTFSDPIVRPNLKKSGAQSVAAIKNEALNKARTELDKKKEAVKAKASEQASKILADAEKEAEKVRILGKNTADAVRKEADDKATQLVQQATNPITRRAAEVSAKKIRDEAEKQASKIESEANQKADDIMERAQKEADRLK